MTNPKRIKISKIQDKMLDINVKIWRVKCLSHILYQCVLDDCNLNPYETEALAEILYEEIRRIEKRYDKVERILNI